MSEKRLVDIDDIGTDTTNTIIAYLDDDSNVLGFSLKDYPLELSDSYIYITPELHAKLVDDKVRLINKKEKSEELVKVIVSKGLAFDREGLPIPEEDRHDIVEDIVIEKNPTYELSDFELTPYEVPEIEYTPTEQEIREEQEAVTLKSQVEILSRQLEERDNLLQEVILKVYNGN